MKQHTNPFDQTGTGPIIAGLIIFALVWIVGIAGILFMLWKFIAWLF